jgi:hypothetical protein
MTALQNEREDIDQRILEERGQWRQEKEKLEAALKKAKR